LKRLRLILMSAVIAFAAIFVIWRIGFYTPEAGKQIARDVKSVESKPATKPEKGDESQRPGGPREAVGPQGPGDMREPFGRRGPERRESFGRRGRFEPDRPFEPGEPNEMGDQLESLNLKDVQMKDIVQKLAEWTGKVIIPDDESMKQKVTIYSSKKLPRDQALLMIYSALRAKGIIAEQTDNMIYLKPIADAKLGSVPTISADYPLASIENKSQVVQKFFKLLSYSPTQMGDIILPLIGEYGYVSADENSGNLLVIDTVENLMRIEKIIAQFDVPEAEQTVTRIFEIRYGDPAEIVQLLEMLLADSSGRSYGGRSSSGRSSSGRGSDGRGSRDSGRGGRPVPPAPPTPGSDKSSSSKKAKTSTTSVLFGPSQAPVVLIPEPRRKWIVARASAEDMKRLGEWIDRLDRQEPVPAEYETIQITYADVSEVAERLNEALQDMPGTQLQASILVQPLTQAGQIMVFGREDMREMVRKLIEEIDIPLDQYETEHFKLKYADPDQIKESLDELYEEDSSTSSRSFGRSSRFGRSTTSSIDKVKIISYSSLKQITVIASAENVEKIREQIEQWDVPIDVNEVKPRIIALENSDPEKLADLLATLFSEETSGRASFWDLYYGRGEDKQKIVGPLYGQLTFEAVPDTKKIIVISNIPEAYIVVEQLIKELDSMKSAELPVVVTLNYADAEDLCDQLNAILNETGTTATIRRSQQGLSSYTTDDGGTTTSAVGQDSSSSTDVITPWWDRARSTAGDEMPISNLIGKIRFIPVHRSKAILVLAPKEYLESIKEMIKELDQPGKQVMIKAIIVEVDHSEMTTLGVRLTSDDAFTVFGDLGENAVTALTDLSFLETHGAWTLNASTSVNALVDLLVKETNGRVLNQPTLWTKDNEEAEFFKGKQVAFITTSSSSVVSSDARATDKTYDYEQVGVTLRVRPNITPEKNVDMTINLIISQVEQDLINTQIATSELNTTTHLIVKDGQTIMLGGILYRNENEIERKVPLLGDLPIVGGLFRHYDAIDANNELLVFLTPYVVDAESSQATVEELEKTRDKLENALKELEVDTEDNE